TFQHWSGVSPYTSPYGFAETCVFDKQSLGKLSLRPVLLLARHIANLRLAFLPSSLTNTLPFILGYSPSPPVSVCGTDTCIINLEVFPGTLLLFLSSALLPRVAFLHRIRARRIYLPDILKET